MFLITILNIPLWKPWKDLPVPTSWKKSFLGRRSTSVSADSIFVKREERKGRVVSTFSHVCLALRTWCLFCRRGVRGGTKFCAHAWTFLPVRWWSHHRRTRVNYYWFQMTTSALTWSSNARSKCDMHSPGFRTRRFGTRWHISAKEIRQIQKIAIEHILKSLLFQSPDNLRYKNIKK